MLTAETWNCPTCAQPCRSRYCPDCGERAPHAHDLTVAGFAEHAVEEFAHVDGRVFRTFRSLVRHPGELTESYVRGRRKPVLGPLQVFIIANLIFFGFQSLFHASVFSRPLASQVSEQYYKRLATQLVDARLEALQTSREEYAPAFDHAAVVNAKSLIILMTPPIALLSSLLFYTRRRPFVTHVVFAVHFYAYWLLMFVVAAPILSIAIVVFMKGAGIRLAPATMDLVTSLFLVSLAVVYLYAAAARVYGERGAARALKVGVLSVTAALTVIGYRFVVFVITLYTTSA